MSGTDSGAPQPSDDRLDRLDRLRTVTGRGVSIDSLSPLVLAMSGDEPDRADVNSSAFCLDANVFLRLPQHDTVIDYLDTQLTTPLILPEQTIQEFWNNHLSVVDTVGRKLQRRFDDLKREGEQLGEEFAQFSESFDSFMNDFENQFGYLYDDATLRRMNLLLDTLQRKALRSSVDRMEFFPIAEMRMQTKTPPGFRDDSFGDFYVWLELLNGAMEALDSGSNFDCVVLVSNEKKIDWVRDRMPHPVLTAEVQELVGKPFQIWDLPEFVERVRVAAQG